MKFREMTIQQLTKFVLKYPGFEYDDNEKCINYKASFLQNIYNKTGHDCFITFDSSDDEDSKRITLYSELSKEDRKIKHWVDFEVHKKKVYMDVDWLHELIQKLIKDCKDFEEELKLKQIEKDFV